MIHQVLTRITSTTGWTIGIYLKVRETPEDREEFHSTVKKLFPFKEFTLGKKGVSRVCSAAEIQT